MDPALWSDGTAATWMALAASTLVAVLAVVVLRGRRRAERELAELRSDVADLRDAVTRLSHEVDETRISAASAPAVRRAEFVITDVPVSTGSTIPGGSTTAEGSTGNGGVDAQAPVADRVVLSATVGEPLVKAVAFGYGVRRALSAESRNWIGFEMRREVRRARKQRRRDTRARRREEQARERSDEAAA